MSTSTERNGLLEHFKAADSSADFAGRYLNYLSELLQQLDTQAIAQMIETIQAASDRGATVYFVANGGSAAIATHFANDLSFGTYVADAKPLKMVCLSDNPAVLTALGNDIGYENIFLRQLEVYLQPDDVLFLMSVSGNSPNVLLAAEYAQANDVTTIGCTGFSGGKLADLLDVHLHVPTPNGEYGPVEDVFQILDHLMYTYFRLARLGRLKH
ncbi:MAG: SIS domain-containing protein [Chloroflexi bacterium]|nr:SIS domain-containing protein [Chloroflexota bacterium]